MNVEITCLNCINKGTKDIVDEFKLIIETSLVNNTLLSCRYSTNTGINAIVAIINHINEDRKYLIIHMISSGVCKNIYYIKNTSGIVEVNFTKFNYDMMN